MKRWTCRATSVFLGVLLRKKHRNMQTFHTYHDISYIFIKFYWYYPLHTMPRLVATFSVYCHGSQAIWPYHVMVNGSHKYYLGSKESCRCSASQCLIVVFARARFYKDSIYDEEAESLLAGAVQLCALQAICKQWKMDSREGTAQQGVAFEFVWHVMSMSFPRRVSVFFPDIWIFLYWRLVQEIASAEACCAWCSLCGL